MKAVIYALIGITLYAVQNTIIDLKLSHIPTASLLVVVYAISFPIALGFFLYQTGTGQLHHIPSGGTLTLLAAVAIMFFVADFFYVGAYTIGGDVALVTVLLVLVPVISTLMKYMFTSQAPTLYHIASYGFAAIALVFVAVGEANKPPGISHPSQVQMPDLQDQ